MKSDRDDKYNEKEKEKEDDKLYEDNEEPRLSPQEEQEQQDRTEKLKMWDRVGQQREKIMKDAYEQRLKEQRKKAEEALKERERSYEEEYKKRKLAVQAKFEAHFLEMEEENKRENEKEKEKEVDNGGQKQQNEEDAVMKSDRDNKGNEKEKEKEVDRDNTLFVGTPTTEQWMQDVREELKAGLRREKKREDKGKDKEVQFYAIPAPKRSHAKKKSDRLKGELRVREYEATLYKSMYENASVSLSKAKEEKGKENPKQQNEEDAIKSKSLKNRIKRRAKEYSEDKYKEGVSPFLEMAKDVVETGSHYKNWKQARRDFIQPLRGVGNVLLGAVNVIGGLMMLFLSPLIAPFISHDHGYITKLKAILEASAVTVSIGISRIIKGALQILTTPLTWFIKMPTRGILTAIKSNKETEGQTNNTSNRMPVKIRKEPKDGLELYVEAIMEEELRKQDDLSNDKNEKESPRVPRGPSSSN